MKRFTRKAFTLIATLVIALCATALVFANPPAAGYQLFGDAMLVSPGFNSPTAAQIRSDVNIAPNYGGVDFTVPSALTVADLDTLMTDYQFTAGGCGVGSPRFQINVTTPSNGTKNIFVYIGPPPNYVGCALNVWANTGNLAAPTNLVDASQIGGSFYEPYSQVQTDFGSYPVTGVQLVVDSGYAVGGTQTAQVDNVKINNATFTFESADSCKKDGWQQFTTAPGPFTNQGQCVSYFAKGGQ
jgi:hypothetical protein